MGACVLGVSLSVFLLASIPTMLVRTGGVGGPAAPHRPSPHRQHPAPPAQAFRRSALALESLLVTVREEVPDTAATVRLSGLEIADCIEEVAAFRCGGAVG